MKDYPPNVCLLIGRNNKTTLFDRFLTTLQLLLILAQYKFDIKKLIEGFLRGRFDEFTDAFNCLNINSVITLSNLRGFPRTHLHEKRPRIPPRLEFNVTLRVKSFAFFKVRKTSNARENLTPNMQIYARKSLFYEL